MDRIFRIFLDIYGSSRASALFVPLTLGEVLLLTVFGILAISIELCVYKKERNKENLDKISVERKYGGP